MHRIDQPTITSWHVDELRVRCTTSDHPFQQSRPKRFKFLDSAMSIELPWHSQLLAQPRLQAAPILERAQPSM